MKYIYKIAFQGNGGRPFGYWNLPAAAYRARKDALRAARAADAPGLRYGAFLRRYRVEESEWRLAKESRP